MRSNVFVDYTHVELSLHVFCFNLICIQYPQSMHSHSSDDDKC